MPVYYPSFENFKRKQRAGVDRVASAEQVLKRKSVVAAGFSY